MRRWSAFVIRNHDLIVSDEISRVLLSHERIIEFGGGEKNVSIVFLCVFADVSSLKKRNNENIVTKNRPIRWWFETKDLLFVSVRGPKPWLLKGGSPYGFDIDNVVYAFDFRG